MKKISIIFILIILTIFILAPAGSIYAQDEGVILLEPIGGFGEVGSDGKVRVSDFGEYLNDLFLLGIGLASGLAVIYITVGGIQYMTGESIGSKESGREKIMGAIGGLVLALASFLILNTINPDLLEFNIEKAIYDIGQEVRKLQEDRNSNYSQQIITNWNAEQGNIAREVLKQATNGRVSINKSECQNVGQSNCTSLAGINQRLFSGMANVVQKSTNCSIIITAGTEYWLHSGGKNLTQEERLDINLNPTRHKPGNAVVDLASGQCINDYIMGGTFENPSNPHTLNCFKKVPRNGVSYQWEAGSCPGSSGDHWHVEF